ncbi:hypothetical protein B2J93_2417 [Marssonina coronariae]|uniref:Uncharacterized protein n=1 Tax=Diplocarpon coronariae TaxID=2795749 RepID=A0A218Z1Z0_9HELO|nr:hypothetical protein B2J93_2417 [Marssonina coronariae]
MNSSRHANRSGQSSIRGRGRGGRPQGAFNPRFNFETDSPAVPSVSQVIPGAPVSIVLKVDQPTGHQVQGIVAELLTRGNHPRGIKVRLQDGRVGRVQKIASEQAARNGSEGLSGLGRNGEGSGSGRLPLQGQLGSDSGSTMGSYTASKPGDFRVHDLDEPPTSELSLEDYVVVRGSKKRQRKNAGTTQPAISAPSDGRDDNQVPGIRSDTIFCPVCGQFEGDEVAVSHHANSHFE